MLSARCKIMRVNLAGIQRDSELNTFSFASLTLSQTDSCFKLWVVSVSK